MDHSRCRQQLVDDELTVDSRAHLQECGDCASFARRFESVLRAAPSLVGRAMPDGLTARVLERVDQERAAPPAQRSRRPRWKPRRPGAVRSTRPRVNRMAAVAMATAAALILALVALPLLGRDSAQAALLQASRQTASRDTANLVIRGTVDGSPASNEPATTGQTGQFTVATRAQGQMAFGDRFHLVGSSTVEGAGPGVGLKSERFDVAVFGRKAYDMEGDRLRPRPKGLPIGVVLGSPDSVLDLLAAGARGDVKDLGLAQVNGERLHGYRFQVRGDVLRSPLPSSSASGWITEAWIGWADQALRQFTLGGRGTAESASGFNWRASFKMVLFGLGDKVFDQAGERGIVRARGMPIVPLPPGEDLSPFSGRRAEAQEVPVQSVVADEGFWVGLNERDRVFVHLVGRGESLRKVRAGAKVSFTGTITKNPADLAGLGVSADEGAALLQRQGYHVEVHRSDLRVGQGA